MPLRDLCPAVFPDSGISPFEAAALVASWTTVTHLGALGSGRSTDQTGAGYMAAQATHCETFDQNDLPPL